ncbi:hypothetical protein EYF80_029284 [Liparis tanakae]|uniref:Uncharacterized protein n=1 Tax=Liparis tanakae TaxID=230148 RepID=A0A4Z2H5V8_9TELE|nr:hypothetical protein EYF80_029284 [Liparis tanakae]
MSHNHFLSREKWQRRIRGEGAGGGTIRVFLSVDVPVRHTSSWKRSAGGKQRLEKGNRPRDLGRSAPDAGQRGSLNRDPPEERNPEKPSKRKNEAPIFRGGSRICSPPKGTAEIA